ncbi:DUF3679 domain-containing protein [Bacillus sp. EB01]|uniref:DUF3679 domain-containing protein n=1 Tax=Bacillus sp. EB01 TaxID=1347086 RepID=UPI0005C4D49B|nr:DUF3679 domain-containing protein [Bacillus sp. EB01]
MKLFMVKSLVLAGFMFAAALIGMQAANTGIDRMKGYEDPDFKQAVSIQKENGETQVAIMGGEVSETFEEKKAQLEKTEGYNLFSSMGKGLGTILSGLAKAVVEAFTD